MTREYNVNNNGRFSNSPNTAIGSNEFPRKNVAAIAKSLTLGILTIKEV
jgi:hypothetical protein